LDRKPSILALKNRYDAEFRHPGHDRLAGFQIDPD
jgi:hypothetical protein